MCIIICSSRPISREMSVLMLAIMQENSTAFRTKDSVSLILIYILSVIDKVIKEVCLTNYLVISDYELQKSFIIKFKVKMSIQEYNYDNHYLVGVGVV